MNTKRTPQEIEQDILQIEKMDNLKTDAIDRTETFKEIFGNLEKVDTDTLFDVMIFWASHHERLAVKFYKHQQDKDYVTDFNPTYWEEQAKEQEEFATEIRDMMTQIVRDQKNKNRIINLVKNMYDES